MILLTWKAPEPEEKSPRPRSLRDAVWQPFIGFLGSSPRARDPGVRPALQALRPAHAGADAALPDRHGLQRRPPRHRARHRRPGRDHRRIGRRRVGHDDGRARALVVGLRLPAGVLEPRVLLRVAAGPPGAAADVRRHQLRVVHLGPRHRRVRRAAAAHDAETFLGHAVRALLEPLRAAAPAGRARLPASRSTRWGGRRSSCRRW